jgi:Flp pilus assembly protein TadG
MTRLAKDKRGVAAVEFALILPLMITLLFGLIEVNETLIAHRRVQSAAAAAADVVARDTRVTNAEINDLFNATGALIFPLNGAGLDMRISSVELTSAGQGLVLWSDGRGYGALSEGATVTLDSRVDRICPGVSAIMAEVRYVYQPPSSFLFQNAFTFEQYMISCPRAIDPIRRDRS